MKKKSEKMLSSKGCHFVQKKMFLVSKSFMQMSLHCVVPEINIGGVEFLIQELSKQYVELQRAVTLKVLNPSP